VLDAIEGRGMRWGIVTNKAGWLTTPLLKALRLDGRAGCVVSGDTLPQRKPHPAPVLLACSQLGTAPERTAFVGDDERDVQAAHAAGAIPVVVRWGYFPPGAADTWGATHLVERPQDLLALLDGGDARA
jgi:phosphoglycolate phosphatase